MTTVPLVLASGSPRRKEILEDMNLLFEVRSADVDETLHKDEDAESASRRLALEKAEAVAKDAVRSLVLAADTLVVIDHEILGKPEDEKDARRMLRLLSGRAHDVITGMAFILREEDIKHVVHSRTSVLFRELSNADIDDYIATGEYAGKAGAYAIQSAGRSLIESHSGSFSNVVGLPVTEVLKFASTFGIDRFPWR